MPRIRMRDGTSIHVRVLGKGAPVFLLHGFGMQSLHWLPFALPLSLSHQVIIPDLRGFGASHEVSHNQRCIIENYAEDINDLADSLGFDKFKMAGISMGALTGLKFISHHPDRVQHYLHIDQAPRCMNNRDWQWGLFGKDNVLRIERASALVDALEPYCEQKALFSEVPKYLQDELWLELGEFFASALSGNFQKNIVRKLSEFPALASKTMPTSNWPVYVHCLKAYIEQDYDLLNDLEDISTPVSLIVGMKSEMYPSNGQLRMSEHLPNCKVIPFYKSGHTPLIDQPFKLMRELHRLARA